MSAKYAKILADNVKALMAERDLSQKEFGVVVELDQPVVSRILRLDMPNPTLKTLLAIATPFKRDPAWLLTDHTKPPAGVSPTEAWQILGRAIGAFPMKHAATPAPAMTMADLEHEAKKAMAVVASERAKSGVTVLPDLSRVPRALLDRLAQMEALELQALLDELQDPPCEDAGPVEGPSR